MASRFINSNKLLVTNDDGLFEMDIENWANNTSCGQKIRVEYFAIKLKDDKSLEAILCKQIMEFDDWIYMIEFELRHLNERVVSILNGDI